MRQKTYRNNLAGIIFSVFSTIIFGQQTEVVHPGGEGLVVRSSSSFSTIDVDASDGDAAFRLLDNGSRKWVIHFDPLDGSLKFTEFANPTALTISSGTGDVDIRGNISKGGGSFKIDHPLDPENKYLYHSFVESPDMMNIYNGNTVTDSKGLSTITLPDYFESLNRDFRYQLTVLGSFARAMIAKEIDENRFTVATDRPNVKVSWQITGVRRDPYAEKNRIPNVVEKKGFNKGRYLYPEAYGKPMNLSENSAKQLSSSTSSLSVEKKE
ncbi:MAG: hypothetical protein KDC80_15995 [Saprospiraceae bacterium]|nr:hypothetical protein [Saprospiraceae bacterium]